MLDRFPELKIVSVESGAGWIPFILEALDYEMDENAPRRRRALSLLPSEYFKRQIYATTWFERTRPRARSSPRSARTTSCSRPTSRTRRASIPTRSKTAAQQHARPEPDGAAQDPRRERGEALRPLRPTHRRRSSTGAPASGDRVVPRRPRGGCARWTSGPSGAGVGVRLGHDVEARDARPTSVWTRGTAPVAAADEQQRRDEQDPEDDEHEEPGAAVPARPTMSPVRVVAARTAGRAGSDRTRTEALTHDVERLGPVLDARFDRGVLAELVPADEAERIGRRRDARSSTRVASVRHLAVDDRGAPDEAGVEPGRGRGDPETPVGVDRLRPSSTSLSR